ncbi:UNKNOWN [Stylonychia lemnae]|uniref:Uncharacterized protein n=1 Tax=Stylonychia lemnae TaxID=5949 RepID=A0A078A5W9_STYLE|nr:UNKNOWN [Stylonychia lemnae]|eukprot:CDW77589.1 UNKNOWN [Stylonychia lemnae]
MRRQQYLEIKFKPFIQANQCNYPITYITNSDFITTNEIQLISKNDQIIVYHFQTQNNELAHLDKINFRIIAQTEIYNSSSLNQPLNISIKVVKPNSQGPKFYKKLEQLDIYPGEIKYYKFPDIFDFDNDSLKEAQLDLFRAQQFVLGSFPRFFISPEVKYIGNYSIKVTLIDDNVNPLQSIYYFRVNVLKIPPVKITTTPQQQIIGEFNDEYLSSKYANSKIVKATLKSVNLNGLAKVTFNTRLSVPQQFYDIDNKTLILKIYGISGLERQIDFSWNIVSFKQSQLEIQLVFKNPSQISVEVILGILKNFNIEI